MVQIFCKAKCLLTIDTSHFLFIQTVFKVIPLRMKQPRDSMCHTHGRTCTPPQNTRMVFITVYSLGASCSQYASIFLLVSSPHWHTAGVIVLLVLLRFSSSVRPRWVLFSQFRGKFFTVSDVWAPAKFVKRRVRGRAKKCKTKWNAFILFQSLARFPPQHPPHGVSPLWNSKCH